MDVDSDGVLRLHLVKVTRLMTLSRSKGEKTESGSSISEGGSSCEKAVCLYCRNVYKDCHRQEGGQDRGEGGQGREIRYFVLLSAKTKA